MKEIDKLIIATNIVNEWRYENQREHDNEESNDYTEAARAVGAMHALSSLFDMRGEDAPPIEETVFSMFAKGLAHAMNKEKEEQKETVLDCMEEQNND